MGKQKRKSEMEQQKECQQCGVCCLRGGPALHQEDLSLVKSGRIPLEHLITIRQGELVYKPGSSTPQPAKCELIKIRGTGKDWQCHYYDAASHQCGIYTQRPLSCRKLQCWNTTEIEALIEEGTISRFDILDAGQPLTKLVREHENVCPCPDMLEVDRRVKSKTLLQAEEYAILVNNDMRYRSAAINKLNLSLKEELFYFGRPLFHLFQQLGVKVTEKEGVLSLKV